MFLSNRLLSYVLDGRVRAVVLVIAAGWLVAGCGPAEPLIDLAPTRAGDDASVSMEPGVLTLAKATVIEWDGVTSPISRELLRDRVFGSLASAGAAWSVYSDASHATVVDGEAPPSEAGADAVAVRLGGGPEVRLSQETARIGTLPDSSWVIASVWAQCNAAGRCYLSLSHEADGGAVAAEAVHPGDGEWHELRIEGPYVWNLQPGAMTFGVRVNGKKASALVASPSLRVAPVTPAMRLRANGDALELLANGSFEAYGDAGSYFPWRMNAWRGKAGEVSVSAMDDAPDGRYAVTITRPEGATRLFQWLPSFDVSRRGTRFVGTAQAKAGQAGDCTLAVRLVNRSGEQMDDLSALTDHPGDGAWHELKAEVTLPDDASLYPVTLKVDIFRRNSDPGPVYFDAISLRLVP